MTRIFVCVAVVQCEYWLVSRQELASSWKMIYFVHYTLPQIMYGYYCTSSMRVVTSVRSKSIRRRNELICRG